MILVDHVWFAAERRAGWLGPSAAKSIETFSIGLQATYQEINSTLQNMDPSQIHGAFQGAFQGRWTEWRSPEEDFTGAVNMMSRNSFCNVLHMVQVDGFAARAVYRMMAWLGYVHCAGYRCQHAA